MSDLNSGALRKERKLNHRLVNMYFVPIDQWKQAVQPIVYVTKKQF